MNSIKAKLNSFRQKPVLVYSMGCLFMLILSVLFVYYLRVIYSPVWMGQIKWSAIVFVALFLMFSVFFFSSRLSEKNQPLFMAIIIFVLGAMFSFATPINQVPDENTHFLRGVQMAFGEWGFDENYRFPDDVNLLMECFPVAYNNGYPAKDTGIVYDRYFQFWDKNEAGVKARHNSGIIIFQVIPYIPLAFGIFAARIMGFSAMGMYWMGRLANVAFFTLCAYSALKLAKRFRVIMFSLMTLPLMCFMYGSCNSDAFLFALMFLMFGTILSDRFDTLKFIVFSVVIAVLTACKPTYIVFILLILCIDRDEWDVKVKDKKLSRMLSIIFAIVLAGIIWEGMSLYVNAFSNYGAIDRTMADTDMKEQLIFIIRNPLRYMRVFADTLKNNAFFLFSGGLLGWLDVNIPLVNYLSPIIISFIAVSQADRFTIRDAKRTWMFFICSVLTYCTAITGLYLSWTPVTLPQVIGMQMRYVYPAFMGFCMVIGQHFSGRMNKDGKRSDLSCVLVSYIFSITACILMLIVYSLPERAAVFVA